ncbi:MAG: TonB family protein [Cellvibrionaceae bacterium]|nr:TonB family protein [Cellvibrionaceae bacterium]
MADQMLNGVASYSKLGKERFLAGLYLEQSSGDAEAILSASGPQKMEMRITARRLFSRSLAKLWIESMAINNSADTLAAQAEAMVKFSKLIKRSLYSGDQLQVHRRADGHTYLQLNGQALGKIEQAGFFQTLLRSWLGQVPLSSSFKAQLLVSGDIDEAIHSRYSATTPSPERLQQMAAARVSPTPTRAKTNNNAPVLKPTAAAPATEVPQAPATEAPQATATEAPQIAVPVVSPLPLVQAAAPQLSNSTEQELPAEPVPELASLEPAILNADTLETEFEDVEEAEAELTAEALLNRQLYHSKLVKWVYRHVKYPKRAIARNQQGSVRLELIIDRSGQVRALDITSPSNYPILNKAAKSAINKATPFPPMPATMPEQEFNFTLPIVFRLPD